MSTPRRAPSNWRPIKTAPKDGTRVLLCHKGADELMVHVGWWADQVVPRWLFDNLANATKSYAFGHKLLPSRNPHCRGRWVAEAADELEHGMYLVEDLKVMTPYVWDPIKREDLVGWMPLPKPPSR